MRTLRQKITSKRPKARRSSSRFSFSNRQRAATSGLMRQRVPSCVKRW
jgi:hypothetical protein